MAISTKEDLHLLTGYYSVMSTCLILSLVKEDQVNWTTTWDVVVFNSLTDVYNLIGRSADCNALFNFLL